MKQSKDYKPIMGINRFKRGINNFKRSINKFKREMILVKRFSIIFMLLLLLLIQAGCGGQNQNDPGDVDGVSKSTEARYSELEIRDYEGTRLDPSVGPRDNSISGIQEVDMTTYSLEITGLVNKKTTLKYDEVLALPSYEKLITLNCVEGWDATVLWKGALLKDIIDLAEVDEKANSVIFHCVDGYTTSLPLADVIEKNMILAYSSNDIVLPAALGFPFIVVAEDKLGYKWARWVNEIELSSDAEYRGYWEQRGYSNEADLN